MPCLYTCQTRDVTNRPAEVLGFSEPVHVSTQGNFTLGFFKLRGSIISWSEQKPQICLPLSRQIQRSSHTSAINASSKFHFFHFQILHNIFHLFIFIFSPLFLFCFFKYDRNRFIFSKRIKNLAAVICWLCMTSMI